MTTIAKVEWVKMGPNKALRAIIEFGGELHECYVAKKSEPLAAGDYCRVWSYTGSDGKPRLYCASL